MTLADRRCVPCKGGIPPMPRPQAERYLAETPLWRLDEAATHITRRFEFKDFAAALAEAEGHHPDIAFGWGYAEIVFYTHKIKGLHENDFIMAAKIDALV